MKAAGIITGSILSLLAIGLTASCGGRKDQSAVPKPEAWPRIELPASDYRPYTYGSTELFFNSSADVSAEQRADKAWWLTVRYPQFHNAAIYLTLSTVTPGEISTVIENRRERMELNTGGAVTVLTELTSTGGWHCELAETRSSLTTPVQLLATDSASVLSGALYLNLPHDSSPDSISPVVGTVRDDLLFLLKNLRP